MLVCNLIFYSLHFLLLDQVLIHFLDQHLFCLFWVLHHHLILVQSFHQFTEISLKMVFLQSFCSCLSKCFVSYNFRICRNFYHVFNVVLIINFVLKIYFCFDFDLNSRIRCRLIFSLIVIFEYLSVLDDIFFNFFVHLHIFDSFNFSPILVDFFELSFFIDTIYIIFLVASFFFSLFLR